MCRAVVEGGRRCPCTRGDRRRAYQRLRYAARQAATAAVGEHTTATVDDPSSAEPSSLEQRRAETTAAVDEALTALRDADRSGDPDVHEAYLNAVLDHGAVLRDIADQKIERAYAEHRLDDASVSAETAAVAEELEQIESEWREAKKHTDNYLTADGTSFVSDDAAAAIDHARNTYATAKQDIYRRALARSKEINEQRAQLAKQVYYEELSRERSFGGPVVGPRLRSLQHRQDDQSRPSYVHRFHGAVSRRDGRARQQSRRHARQTIEGQGALHRRRPAAQPPHP